VNRLSADSLKALHKKHGRKAPPSDLIGDIPLVVLNPDSGQFFGQIGITDVPSLRGVAYESVGAKAMRSLTAAVQASLTNHNGKTVQQIGEGIPKRWRLAT
jgi:hypothetical protein